MAMIGRTAAEEVAVDKAERSGDGNKVLAYVWAVIALGRAIVEAGRMIADAITSASYRK